MQAQLDPAGPGRRPGGEQGQAPSVARGASTALRRVRLHRQGGLAHLLGDRFARVDDGHRDGAVAAFDAHLDRGAARGVLNGVADEVFDREGEQRLVDKHGVDDPTVVHVDVQARLARAVAAPPRDVLHHRGDAHLRHGDREVLALGEHVEVGDDALEHFAGDDGVFDRLSEVGIDAVVLYEAARKLQVGHDRRERVADVVRHEVEELSEGAVVQMKFVRHRGLGTIARTASGGGGYLVATSRDAKNSSRRSRTSSRRSTGTTWVAPG